MKRARRVPKTPVPELPPELLSAVISRVYPFPVLNFFLVSKAWTELTHYSCVAFMARWVRERASDETLHEEATLMARRGQFNFAMVLMGRDAATELCRHIVEQWPLHQPRLEFYTAAMARDSLRRHQQTYYRNCPLDDMTLATLYLIVVKSAREAVLYPSSAYQHLLARLTRQRDEATGVLIPFEECPVHALRFAGSNDRLTLSTLARFRPGPQCVVSVGERVQEAQWPPAGEDCFFICAPSGISVLCHALNTLHNYRNRVNETVLVMKHWADKLDLASRVQTNPVG